MSWFVKKSIKVLSITPPLAAPTRHGYAVVVCVKNEGAYIAEWLRFHKMVGIRHFFVYDNGSTDDTVDALRATVPSHEFTLVPWGGRVVSTKTSQLIDGQVLAYSHAILNFGQDFRRMAFIDVDEFLLPRNGATIQEALATTGDFPNISLPWHMFGTSGHRVKPEGPVVLSYTKRAANPLTPKKHSTNFKCIVDPCEVIEVAVHHFKTKSFGDSTSNDAGFRATQKTRQDLAFYSNAFLQLNHYYSKSHEEMDLKFSRGSNFAASSEALALKMKTTMQNIENDEVEDRSMVEFVSQRKIMLA